MKKIQKLIQTDMFQCSFCDEQLSTELVCQMHEKLCKKNPNRVSYKCPECSKEHRSTYQVEICVKNHKIARCSHNYTYRINVEDNEAYIKKTCIDCALSHWIDFENESQDKLKQIYEILEQE